MSKTHRRSRQRRGKLSRRMKKRGGGPHNTGPTESTRSRSRLSTIKKEENKEENKFAEFNHKYKIIQDEALLQSLGETEGGWVEVRAKTDLKYVKNEKDQWNWTIVAHPRRYMWRKYLNIAMTDYPSTPRWLDTENRDGRFWIPEEVAKAHGFL
jgi:hypothetical protein